jgi:hypothetical protein
LCGMLSVAGAASVRAVSTSSAPTIRTRPVKIARPEPPDEAPPAGAEVRGGRAHQSSRAPSSTRLARRTS